MSWVGMKKEALERMRESDLVESMIRAAMDRSTRSRVDYTGVRKITIEGDAEAMMRAAFEEIRPHLRPVEADDDSGQPEPTSGSKTR